VGFVPLCEIQAVRTISLCSPGGQLCVSTLLNWRHAWPFAFSAMPISSAQRFI